MSTHELVKKMLEAYYSGPESVPSIAAMKKALAVVPLPEWRPISEAPKDGKPFLAGWWSDTYWQCEKAHWANGPVYEGDNGIDGLIEVPATHWQPLPEPPKEME